MSNTYKELYIDKYNQIWERISMDYVKNGELGIGLWDDGAGLRRIK